jgi:CheY-like chemotaxis protein
MKETQKCLLVIDDQDDYCQIIREKFEILGYKVLIAHDGAEGLRMTEEGRPDCVILDVLIPKGEDGLTYFRKLRTYCHKDPQEQRRIRKTPVIVLTGAGTALHPIIENDTEKDAIENLFNHTSLPGINGFLEKPFDLRDLNAKIESVLGAR